MSFIVCSVKNSIFTFYAEQTVVHLPFNLLRLIAKKGNNLFFNFFYG